jgi:hypothetical protein
MMDAVIGWLKENGATAGLGALVGGVITGVVSHLLRLREIKKQTGINKDNEKNLRDHERREPLILSLRERIDELYCLTSGLIDNEVFNLSEPAMNEINELITKLHRDHENLQFLIKGSLTNASSQAYWTLFEFTSHARKLIHTYETKKYLQLSSEEMQELNVEFTKIRTNLIIQLQELYHQ